MVQLITDPFFSESNSFFQQLQKLEPIQVIHSSVNEIVSKVFETSDWVFSEVTDIPQKVIHLFSEIDRLSKVIDELFLDFVIDIFSLKWLAENSLLSDKNLIRKSFPSFISEQELQEVTEQILPLFTNRCTSLEKFEITDILRAIEKTNRDNLFSALPLILPENPIGSTTIYVLERLVKISKEIRIEVLEEARFFFTEKMHIVEKGMLLFSIAKIPKEERSSILDLTKQFSSRIDFYGLLDLINELPFIPPHERASIAEEFAILEERKIRRFGHKAHTPHLLLLYLLPENLRTPEKLGQIPEGVRIVEIPEYQAVIAAALEKKFIDTKVRPSTLLELAYFVTATLELPFHDEHPVMQKSIEIIAANNTGGIKNPFYIHQKLKTLRQQPVDFTPPSMLVEGINSAINIKTLQLHQSWVKITRDMLPQSATLEAWNQLTESLKVKIEENPESLNDYGTTVDQILTGCLNDPYLSGFFTLSDQRVSLLEAKFKAIFSNILSKESSLLPGQFFTEQEDLLIRVAMSIQYCHGGKQEGIDGAYRWLDINSRYPVKMPENSSGDAQKELMTSFMIEIVHSFIASQFDGNSRLLQRLTNNTHVRQGVHQSIYLKNLIGHLIGLNHELTFDWNSNILYNDLVKKEPIDALKAFFDNVTPETMAAEVVRAVNADLNSTAKMVHPFLNEDCWDLQEDDVTLLLNKRGAIKLLEVAGYLLVL